MRFSRRCEVRGLPGKFLVVRESYLNWRVAPDDGKGNAAGPRIKVSKKDIVPGSVQTLRVRPKLRDNAGRPYAGRSYASTVEIDREPGRFFVVKEGKNNSRVIARDPGTKVAVGESFVVPNSMLKKPRSDFENYEGTGTIGPHGELVVSAPLREECDLTPGTPVIMTLTAQGILVRRRDLTAAGA